MSVLWKLEPATAAKHGLYKRYMDAWWPKLLQPATRGFLWPRVTYVDAFAGPGRYEDGEEGSPIFVLKRLLGHSRREEMRLNRDRVRLVFVEKMRSRYEHLITELRREFGDLSRLPVTVQVRHGEAAMETASALDELNAWGNPILAIFDSWGNVRVPLTLVAQLAANRSSEAFVTFGPNWFNRRETLNPDQLDEVFGGRDRWRRADLESEPDERWRVWLETYRESLASAGFQYRLQFEIVPHTGLPLYLVYGTTHPAGVEAMKDAMWKVDGNDGMGFRDPRTRGAPGEGQLSLFSGADNADPELLELVTQRLREGPATVESLRAWLLLETARWKRNHATGAVMRLCDAGRVTVEPAGRIRSSSLVKLN